MRVFSGFVALLLALALCAPLRARAEGTVETAGEADAPAVEVAAPSAVLMEKVTGEVLYAKGEHERRPPASVTKVMTMLLIAEAVDAGEITLEDEVTASAEAASMGGSQVWLEEGERMTVSDMLKCIAVVSANDCAVAMAEYISGSEEAFVRRMNERAQELGLADTHFTNCTGLFDDEEHYTSACDIALMSRELMLHEWIKDYTTIWMDSIREGEFGLSNTNKLVRRYSGCTGLKTGFTSEAMYCLSATAEREGVEFIAVIMHADTIDSRNSDASALLDYGFANYTLCSLRPDSALPPVRVELGERDSVQPVCTGEEALLMPRSGSADISRSVALVESVRAPVREGDRLGTLSVLSGGEIIAEVPIVADSDVGRLSAGGVWGRLLGLLVSYEGD